MNQKTVRRLEDLERDIGGTGPVVRVFHRDENGVARNTDGTPYVEDLGTLPAGSKVIEVRFVAPPNRPPDPPFEPTVKPKLGPAVESQVRH